MVVRSLRPALARLTAFEIAEIACFWPITPLSSSISSSFSPPASILSTGMPVHWLITCAIWREQPVHPPVQIQIILLWPFLKRRSFRQNGISQLSSVLNFPHAVRHPADGVPLILCCSCLTQSDFNRSCAVRVSASLLPVISVSSG